MAASMQWSKFVSEFVYWRRPSSLLYQLLQLANRIRCRSHLAAVISIFLLTISTSSITITFEILRTIANNQSVSSQHYGVNMNYIYPKKTRYSETRNTLSKMSFFVCPKSPTSSKMLSRFLISVQI